jgi:4'-phosphopantetheinyl transferase EntD
VLERILPDEVKVAATRGELEVELFAEEESAIERAVQKRRREFVTGRACAREALAQLGRPATPILPGPRGEPLWPAGIVGSITHCKGYRACAVAPATDLRALGIDAEPDEPLPDGLLSRVALPEERQLLRDLDRRAPGPHYDRLLFSIKESVFKAWYPLAEGWLGFEDAVVSIDPRRERFSAHLLAPAPGPTGEELRAFHGRWLAEDGLLISAVALPARPGRSA